jgi:hypothetical protein
MVNVETLLEKNLDGIQGCISEEEDVHGLPITFLPIDFPCIGRYQAVYLGKLRDLLGYQ